MKKSSNIQILIQIFCVNKHKIEALSVKASSSIWENGHSKYEMLWFLPGDKFNSICVYNWKPELTQTVQLFRLIHGQNKDKN